MTDEVQIEPVESVENVDGVETAIDWSKAQVGLSNLSRYVHWQSCPPTMREQLTQDFVHGLSNKIGPEAVLIEISATPLCETMRGVEIQTETVTRRVVGEPAEEERRGFNKARN